MQHSPHKKMLLMSSSRYKASGYLEHAGAQFEALYGNEKYNILLIPYAAVTASFDNLEGRVKPMFEKQGHRIKSIHHFTNHRKAVEEASAIAVAGGNTFALLKMMYDHDIVDAIRDKVNAGIPYIGWSAGGNIAGPTIRTTNDMPIVEPPSFDALNLIPFQTNPHFISGKMPGHNGESREDRLSEFLTYNKKEELLSMPEGTALLCEGDQATVMGADGMLWFKQTGQIETMPDGHVFKLNSIKPA